MKKTDWSYIAGFFDGEGTISLVGTRPATNRQQRTFRLRVSLTSTNEWAIQSIKFFCGGVIGVDTHKGQSEVWKTAYIWSICDNKAYVFLKQIYPYLKLKRAQAELAFLFQEHKKGGGYKSKEYIDFETDFKQQITLLNHRGK